MHPRQGENHTHSITAFQDGQVGLDQERLKTGSGISSVMAQSLIMTAPERGHSRDGENHQAPRGEGSDHLSECISIPFQMF